MKTRRFIPRLPAKAAACLALGTMAAGLAQAQPFANFNSGSTGTVDLVITTNTTITLPPEGILHYRNITINSGATLRFNANALNTPVHLLARSNVLINGTIDVSGNPGNGIAPGQGGPGGFAGGFGANAGGPQSLVGDGKGPGGGKGWINRNNCGRNYGNAGSYLYGNALCIPLIGGSGAAGGPIIIGVSGGGGGGGGGGGAILIAANGWITNNGIVRALGGDSGIVGCARGGSGSGGAIRLVARLVSGNGVLDVGSISLDTSMPGGAGRVRVDSTNSASARSTIQTSPTSALVSFGSQTNIFPQDNRLTIASVTVGGETNPINPLTPAAISLPAGADTNAIVRVVASGPFYGALSVPIAVVVTPENGPSATYTNDVSLLNSNGIANVTVTIPAGTISTLNAWTR